MEISEESQKFFGTSKKRVSVSMAPRSARILLLHRLPVHPKVIATNLHVLGGYHEIERQEWDERHKRLSGICRRMPGLEGRLYVYVPEGYKPVPSRTTTGTSHCTHRGGPLWSTDLAFKQATAEFNLSFDSDRSSPEPR